MAMVFRAGNAGADNRLAERTMSPEGSKSEAPLPCCIMVVRPIYHVSCVGTQPCAEFLCWVDDLALRVVNPGKFENTKYYTAIYSQHLQDFTLVRWRYL